MQEFSNTYGFRVLIVAVAIVCTTVSLVHAQTISYVGVIYDRTDFDRLNIGKSGYWFPQFGATTPVSGRPTGENARDALPPWAGPLNHATSIFDPNYATRTFSQDGPARSKGGQSSWNPFKLPSGETGLSGAIVDPYTSGNSNNTINRIQLNAGVPSTFYFHIVTDNTNFEHDPTNRLRARGNAGGIDIEANFFPRTSHLFFNGIADVYTFRYDGFAGGDFIKLQLNGDANKTGASFGGLLFDVVFEPNLSLPMPGDYNSNNAVETADYILWRKTLGLTGFFLAADGSANQEVDEQDYLMWRELYGQSTSSGLHATLHEKIAIPETNSGLLLFTAWLFMPFVVGNNRAWSVTSKS
jgi:hypothetical protein